MGRLEIGLGRLKGTRVRCGVAVSIPARCGLLRVRLILQRMSMITCPSKLKSFITEVTMPMMPCRLFLNYNASFGANSV